MILDVLSEHHGRIRLIGRGAKRSKGGQALRPFNELSFSWSGRSELKSLTAHELVAHRWLQGESLFCGLYANEVTLRALRRHKAEEFLFTAYKNLMASLDGEGEGALELSLRRFEFSLLASIGFGVNFEVDCEGRKLAEHLCYVFEPDVGFLAAAAGDQAYSGKVLAGIHRQAFDDTEVLRGARRLARSALVPHIGPGPLMSRGLYV